MKCAQLIFLIPIASLADVTSTRLTAYDFQCQDTNGIKISDHARFDTAFVACLNAPSGAIVQGGRYRIGKGVVPPPVLGSAALTWTTPTLNVDGSAIGPIIRYELEYGTNPAALVQAVNIPSGLTYTVPGLTPATWYFRMRTVTADGVSDWTGLVNKVIS